MIKSIFILMLFFCISNSIQAQDQDSYQSTECDNPKNVKSDFKANDIVFSGKVFKIEFFEIQSTFFPDNTDNEEAPIISMQRVFFSTIEIFKGVFNLSVIEVVTAVDRELYGYQFEVGKEYIVYGIYQNRLVYKGPTVPIFVYTDICMGTTSYDKEEALKLRKAAQGLLR